MGVEGVPLLTENVTAGRTWLMQMGRAAEKHNLTVQVSPSTTLAEPDPVLSHRVCVRFMHDIHTPPLPLLLLLLILLLATRSLSTA